MLQKGALHTEDTSCKIRYGIRSREYHTVKLLMAGTSLCLQICTETEQIEHKFENSLDNACQKYYIIKKQTYVLKMSLF